MKARPTAMKIGCRKCRDVAVKMRCFLRKSVVGLKIGLIARLNDLGDGTGGLVDFNQPSYSLLLLARSRLID